MSLTWPLSHQLHEETIKQQGGISGIQLSRMLFLFERCMHGRAAELLITGILVGGAASTAAAGDAADEAKELVLELRGKLRHGC